jgi:NADH dehydrogenase FAD-containing subunit
VDPEFVDRVLHPFDKMAQAYPKVTFMQAKLKQVTNMNMIIVEKEGLEIKVNFDVLVLCTGFSYDQPVKCETALTLADRKKNHADFYNKIKDSKSVLIAGAGIVGIELAGEFAVKYAQSNDKRIGICVRGDRLLPGLPLKAARIAEDFLRRHNVEIHFKTPYGPSTAKELGFELPI